MSTIIERWANAVGTDYAMSKYASAADVRAAMLEEIAALRRAVRYTLGAIEGGNLVAGGADQRPIETKAVALLREAVGNGNRTYI